MLSAVQSSGEVLDLFTPESPEWGATDAARALGIAKSQAHRLLSSLASVGLLERGASRRYRLGWRSLALASVMLATSDLIREALPIMRSLHERFGLEVVLGVWDRGCVLTLEPHASPMIERRDPRVCVALSTVLLAGRPAAEIEAASHTCHQTAPHGTGPNELLARLEHVRAGGLVGDFEHGEAGSSHLVAPIIDATGVVIAALSVHAPTPSWHVHKDEFVRGLRAAAVRLTAKTSSGGPSAPRRSSIRPLAAARSRQGNGPYSTA
jgi:DNA-binding IclR family transcriptional regulator